MDLTAVVADDEALARHRVVRLLEGLGVRIVEACGDGSSALQAVKSHAPDAVFLDLDMPGLGGADVAGLIGPDGPCIVFLTAHADHAVQAFAQGAVDYVLKPVDAGRLALTVARIRDRAGAAPTVAKSPVDGRIALPTLDGAVLVDLDRVSHVTIDGASVVLHTPDRKHHTDLRLGDVAQRVGPKFLRVHRQALVHVDALLRLERIDSGGYLAHLRGGAVVEVSRAAARQLRKDWGLPR